MGSRIVLLYLFSLVWLSCKIRGESPGSFAITGKETYKPYIRLYDNVRENSLRKPSPEVTFNVDEGWTYVLGDSTEGLHTKVVRTGKENVKLPHRVSAANHPMWYSKRISIDHAGLFWIRGDDGVQLFVNGKQVQRLSENFFPADFVGVADVTVRVLNNAMQGGLRSLSFLTFEQYEKFAREKDQYLRLKHLTEQVALINDPTDDQTNSVKLAVNDTNDSTLAEAERSFENYPYITGPWVIKEGDTYRVMAWLDHDNELTLHFGSDSTGLNSKLVSTGKIIDFTIPIKSSRIYYKLTCRNTITRTFAIDTKESRPFTFNAWADSQSGWPAFATNIKNIEKFNDAFGLGAGDLVNNGSDQEEWREFYNIISSSASQRPYYLVSGNHDYDGFYDDLIPKLYRSLNKRSNPHYYSWTYQNCAFIALDPNEKFPIGILPGSDQYNWLQNEVKSQSWKNAKWHFIFLHQPPYSQGWDGYTGDHFLRRLIEPIAEDASIDFVIAGHTHDYERLVKNYGSQQTVYLVLGGGGGSLEPAESSSAPKMNSLIKQHHIGHFYVNGDSIRFESIGLDGKTIDSYSRVK